MQPLPPTLATVTIPDFFSPSALGAWGGCPLKLTVSSFGRDHGIETLPSGPEAAIGQLVHRVFERASRNTDAPSLSAIFADEYDRLTRELNADPRRRHFADLEKVKPLAQWTSLKAWVVQQGDRLVARVPRQATRLSQAVNQERTTGPELPLESPTLRLRGRADRVSRIGHDAFEIRDYKSGTVLTPEGAVKDEIALQLRAYGLMLLERHPGASVRLIVDDGCDREVEFDQDAQLQARERIREILGHLPHSGIVPTLDLSSPGAGCSGCNARHVCPSYRRKAPSWWKEFPSDLERTPIDTWGTVSEATPSEPMSMALVDDAGRHVRIDGIDPRHDIATDLVGHRVWWFNLESSGPNRGFDGRRYHPRSFHELPRDRRERRAWSAQFFLEGP